MVHEIKSAELYGLIDTVQPWEEPGPYTELEIAGMTKKRIPQTVLSALLTLI